MNKIPRPSQHDESKVIDMQTSKRTSDELKLVILLASYLGFSDGNITYHHSQQMLRAASCM